MGLGGFIVGIKTGKETSHRVYQKGMRVPEFDGSILDKRKAICP